MTISLAIDNKELCTVPKPPLAYKAKRVNDYRSRLPSILQTTLEVSELITLFYKAVGNIVEISGCCYDSASEGISIQLGEEAPHHYRYQLSIDNEYLGELCFSRSELFAGLELSLLEEAISVLVYPIRNALYYRQAIKSSLTDSLTGVGNRVAFDKTLQKEIEVAKRYQEPLSLLMIDLDHFKSVNDNYGHVAGDAVLKAVVAEIKHICRSSDMVFRYGGEEFLVLLTKTSAEGARTIAERLRAAIADLTCVHEQVEIPVTVSAGCSTWRCNEEKDSFLKRTDDALYYAKENGRDRVVTSEELQD